MSRNLWDKTWKDRQGRVVIWQTPNAFLTGWAVLTFISLFFNNSSHIGDVLSWLGSASLIIWAVLEITRGTDYFRRALGLLIFVLALMSLIKNL